MGVAHVEGAALELRESRATASSRIGTEYLLLPGVTQLKPVWMSSTISSSSAFR